MSFSKQVKDELNSLQLKGNCCKKAYLFGAFLSAKDENGSILLTISDGATFNSILYLLNAVYRCVPEVKMIKRGCFQGFELRLNQKKISEFLKYADSSSENKANFLTCKNCKSAFIRGVFCVSGNVSDPMKSYTLEIRTMNDSRADLIEGVISEWHEIIPPSRTHRNNKIGLFYRNESSIEDLLTACGANKSLFIFYEALVEKNVRNIENRATNCVARNISKSVAASAIQISAIESLIATNFIEEIPHELTITANLRLNNPDISLTELAELHKPPISKSGLNHRLSKIVNEAKKRNLI